MPCVYQDGNTVHVDGCNLQVTNGAGTTESKNGLGNVIVGYNEDNPLQPDPWTPPQPLDRSGSHNLVVGPRHSYQSWGGQLVGDYNFSTAPYASVSGGWGNFARAPFATIGGGSGNRADGDYSAVSGGNDNRATGNGSSVTGGSGNEASGSYGSICGGEHGTAGGWASAIGGGDSCLVTTNYGWCSGQ